MQWVPTFHNEKLLHRTAKADSAKIYCPRKRCRNYINTVSDRPCGSNDVFFIRVLQLLEGWKYKSKELHILLCFSLDLLKVFLKVYSRRFYLIKSIHRVLEIDKGFTELVHYQLKPLGELKKYEF